MSHHPFAIPFLAEKLPKSMAIGAILIVICSLVGETYTVPLPEIKMGLCHVQNVMIAGPVGGLGLQAPPPTPALLG